ncbi:ABC efflux pump, inner membrane subunit [Candidatus Koribacter versatilis Ellin345]|uniref:ABC efflux pump, inner membrane subunit n=1 Tax=Koribacter versatilis (strain Ellin345) TaxID=204669 RepID=Q1IU27_KORVE|nr:ABC transporter permease [Candidatus Koribacter versatilis]ABF39623.1 ABC efflux pump, inner membrane subunit [Candidatus Koribacter versatilis Ellin345]
MHTLLQDLRFASRQLRKNPGFAITTILTLALGIGAATAIFSLVNAVLLRPLPFPEQDKIVWTAMAHTPRNAKTADAALVPGSMSYPDYFDLRKGNKTLQYLSSYHDSSFSVTGRGDARHVDGFTVSADFFRTLGVHPERGRDFLADDEKPGVHVAMLGHSLWQSTFGSDPDIIGKNITIGGLSYTVAGVMPADFNFPVQNPAAQLWTTLADDALDSTGDHPVTVQRGAHFLSMVGRLKPGVSTEQAQADLTVIVKNLAAQYPDTNSHFLGAFVKPQLEQMIGDTRGPLRMLFAAVIFVLLIACANVAGLLLARASRRRSEIAVRSALGATRMQIVRQVMVESVFIGICGGIAGLLLSMALLRLLLRFVPSDIPRLDSVGTDYRVFAFAIVISVITGVLFGVLPAMRISRLDPSASLRDGTRTSSAGRQQHHLHGALVIAETAIGLVLLVGSGLLIRSFVRVMHVDPGFDARHVLLASVDLPDNRYPGDKNVSFFQQLIPRLQALPGVQSVAAGWPLPLTGSMMSISFEIEGHPVPKADEPSEIVSIATPGFFKTIGIPVKRGREFLETDTRTSTKVIILTESFAKKYFPNEDPIGKHVKPGLGDGYTDSVWREVVGVVGDIKRQGLTVETRPEYYLPHTQAIVGPPIFVIRTSGDPTQITNAVRSEVAAMDRNVPVYDVHTYDDLISKNASQPRFQSMLLTCFAALALLLSAIGLYAVLSYMVAQRTLEIGVRMALGARRRDVVNLILKHGLGLALVGLVLGMGLSLVLTRYLSSMLYTIKPLDPVTLLTVTGILLVVAVVASTAPAWRAARLDPMKTLRDQ